MSGRQLRLQAVLAEQLRPVLRGVLWQIGLCAQELLRRAVLLLMGTVVERADDAALVLPAKSSAARLFLTCEHASERLPDPWVWHPEDRWLAGTHWAYDIGAELLTRDLAEATGAPAVLSRFSRLLVDPNREEDSPGLILERAEGKLVVLNHGLESDEREARLSRLHRPYHQAIDRELGRSRAPVVLALHTFTPVWNGVPREVEVGVLFDREDELAELARRELEKTGLVVRMNEPYSGQAGLIYSAARHADAHGLKALELELRQDLALVVDVRAKVVDALSALARAL